MNKAALIRSLVFAVALAAGAYVYRDQVKVLAAQAFHEVRPCTLPITYSIGRIDPRFGISTSTLLNALSKSTAVWNTAAGKELFLYRAESGLVTVNLIFDTRQATTQQLSSIGATLSDKGAAYDALKSEYVRALADYRVLNAEFDAAYASYESAAATYEAEVERWNSRGGAPQGVYASLQEQKSALQVQGRALESMQSEVNRAAQEVNARVAELNALAKSLNADAETYNTVGSAAGSEFEEAVFESRPGREEITVYEYDSVMRLTRVLSHEFGHSLGLDHVDDPAAIMYRLNQSKNATPTKTDMAELDAACRF